MESIANMDNTDLGDGRLVKMEIDCSEKVDAVLPKAQKLAETGSLQQGLDLLYGVEKESRLASDMRSNIRIQIGIVTMCFKAKKYDALCENIAILAKKRSLIKQAVTLMVRECCTYVDQMPNKELCLKLIETIRTVTDGKIYVEVERARLTYKLSKMLEEEGKLDKATSCLLELQIETFGSMDKKEKVEILLEQMRLCLDRQDFVRAQIISRKISIKFFEDKTQEVQNLKLKYYQLMISLNQNDDNYLSICRHFLAISNTEIVEKDTTKLDDVMRNIVSYIILSPYNNEQSDLISRIKENKHLDRVPEYKALLDLFIQQELISWKNDISKKYESLLRQGTKASAATTVFSLTTDLGKKHWDHLMTRVGEHNIRMIAKYYSRITLTRLGELLDWAVPKTETFLCQLIVNGTLENAKIDRPDLIVNFKPRKTPQESLDDWNGNLRSMMDKMSRACHLIAKEEMVHMHLHKNGVKN